MKVTETPVATGYTHEFVRGSLPAGARDVLEIGCGSGELAARLLEDGLAVLAVDASGDCVSAARKRGVEARQLSWPAKLDARFDAILFTRSLHHVHALDESIAAAREALRPGGRLIVEDFQAEGGSGRSSSWYRGLTCLLAACGSFASEFDLEERLVAAEPDQQAHELHSSSAIRDSLAAFGNIEEGEAAYYFRYLESSLRRRESAQALLDHELGLIAAGSIDALGRRFVAYGN